MDKQAMDRDAGRHEVVVLVAVDLKYMCSILKNGYKLYRMRKTVHVGMAIFQITNINLIL